MYLMKCHLILDFPLELLIFRTKELKKKKTPPENSKLKWPVASFP